MAKIKKRLSHEVAKSLGFKPKEKKGHGNPKYSLTEEQYKSITGIDVDNDTQTDTQTKGYEESPMLLSAWDSDRGVVLDIKEYCEKYNLDYDNLASWKFLPHHYKYPSYNVAFREQSIEPKIQDIDFKSIISDLKLKKYKPVKVESCAQWVFDRVVYTDVHIGMNPNKNGFSLYGGKWDNDEIFRRLDIMIDFIISNKKSDIIYIDDLGDFLDGYNGQTTRKGHELPQNLDNEGQFDVGLRFKMILAKQLNPYFNKIVFNNICNDNHAGSFGYTVNSAFKSYAEEVFDNVIVNNYRKFINHYIHNNKCFIITHGKDSDNLKFGFKPFIDSKCIEKIEGYIDYHNLHGYEIEFSKGDSHQRVLDDSSSDKFNYYNYGAFSPSSDWVQTNFKRGTSFFDMFNYKANGQKISLPYQFNWIP